MKTDDLIAAIAADSAPRWSFGPVLAAAILVGAGLSGAAFFAAIGLRPDFMSALETVRFVFKFVFTITLAATAIGLVARLARPAADVRLWAIALVLAPVLLGLGVLGELLSTPAASWGARLVGSNSHVCLTVIPVLSIGPLAAILLALRRGAPSHPALAGAIAGLASAGIAATFYAANCTDDSPLFVATWYPLAIAIVAGAGALLGARLLRW